MSLDDGALILTLCPSSRTPSDALPLVDFEMPVASSLPKWSHAQAEGHSGQAWSNGDILGKEMVHDTVTDGEIDDSSDLARFFVTV